MDKCLIIKQRNWSTFLPNPWRSNANLTVIIGEECDIIMHIQIFVLLQAATNIESLDVFYTI